MLDKKIDPEDLELVLDTMWRQLTEDRDAINGLYDDLKKMTVTIQDYAVNGLTLSKIMEIKIKQTGQLVEVVRMNQRKSKENDKLSEEDKEEVFERIKKE
ncbi:hypothetical protein HYV49_03120 [Candidatus Pacearchaeota archaeon]|nr:hypothetical protein [Candidatus Pacearchaeota archaeon]